LLTVNQHRLSNLLRGSHAVCFSFPELEAGIEPEMKLLYELTGYDFTALIVFNKCK
jgi:hypothetical protein